MTENITESVTESVTESIAGARHLITAPADGERLDRMLAAQLGGQLAGISRSRLKALIEEGRISLVDQVDADGNQIPFRAGGTITDPNFRVKQGQIFAIFIPDPVDAVPKAQNIALDVVYEDSWLIVINKPAGLVVHPAPGNMENTLVNALLAHCGDSLSGIGGVRRPGIVHRLDKETSGLMVAAKCDAAHQALSEQFAAHDLERAYKALVWGVPRPLSGNIEGNIGRSDRNRKKMAIVHGRGRTALTHYRVEQRFGKAAGTVENSVASLVECRLSTGRTHQIRVHMAHIGHPVIGDPVYGGGTRRARRGAVNEEANAAISALGRQALHAATLGFRHPESGKTLTFKSELPSDINMLKDSLEKI
jgi:23S rRNA pseudouridine1911/1915/1917 synthase